MRLLPILLLALAPPDEPQASFKREVQVSRVVVDVVAPAGRRGTHDLEMRLASGEGRVLCRTSFDD